MLYGRDNVFVRNSTGGESKIGTYRGDYRANQLSSALISAVPQWRQLHPLSICAREHTLHLSPAQIRIEDYFLIRSKQLRSSHDRGLKEAVSSKAFNQLLLKAPSHQPLPFFNDKPVDIDSLRHSVRPTNSSVYGNNYQRYGGNNAMYGNNMNTSTYGNNMSSSSYGNNNNNSSYGNNNNNSSYGNNNNNSLYGNSNNSLYGNNMNSSAYGNNNNNSLYGNSNSLYGNNRDSTYGSNNNSNNNNSLYGNNSSSSVFNKNTPYNTRSSNNSTSNNNIFLNSSTNNNNRNNSLYNSSNGMNNGMNSGMNNSMSNSMNKSPYGNSSIYNSNPNNNIFMTGTQTQSNNLSNYSQGNNALVSNNKNIFMSNTANNAVRSNNIFQQGSNNLFSQGGNGMNRGNLFASGGMPSQGNEGRNMFQGNMLQANMGQGNQMLVTAADFNKLQMILLNQQRMFQSLLQPTAAEPQGKEEWVDRPQTIQNFDLYDAAEFVRAKPNANVTHHVVLVHKHHSNKIKEEYDSKKREQSIGKEGDIVFKDPPMATPASQRLNSSARYSSRKGGRKNSKIDKIDLSQSIKLEGGHQIYADTFEQNYAVGLCIENEYGIAKWSNPIKIERVDLSKEFSLSENTIICQAPELDSECVVTFFNLPNDILKYKNDVEKARGKLEKRVKKKGVCQLLDMQMNPPSWTLKFQRFECS